jgi:hypothetical protein
VFPILAHYNHEVVHVVESGNRSLSDPEHLLVVARSERILVTYNRRDFPAIASILDSPMWDWRRQQQEWERFGW